VTPPRLRNVRPRLAVLDVRVASAPAKVADPHYRTPEHQAWRAAVIERSAGHCQDPACRDPQRGRGRRLFADHVVEIKDGGAALDLANGQALCGACHTRKTIAERALRQARPT
jgi:5-methylcytosine-specific restriction enzyme A